MWKKFIYFFGLIVSIFGFSHITLAATYTWDGGGVDNNWTTCANWSSDTCPLTSDGVIFSASSTKDVTIDTNITVTTFSINSGYSGTIAPSGSNTITINGAFSQATGTFTLSSATTTFASSFTYTSGTFNHNSGTVYFNPPSTGGSPTLTTGSAVFNNVTFDMGSGSNVTLNVNFASNMTINGNVIVQNTNTNGGVFTFISNNATATRTMTVAGNLTFPSNAQTGTVNFGASSATTPIAVSLGGNFTLADNNVTMQNVGLTFSSSSNQTITKSAGTISSLNNWYDTGSGNLALTANFSGSMKLNTDSTDDFNFATTSYTFTVGNTTIGSGTSFTPAGPSSYIFSILTVDNGTFNATASTSIVVFSQTGGTFNAVSSATTTFTGSFTYTAGTFNHNSGTVFFNPPSTGGSPTLTFGSATFNNMSFDMGSGSNVTLNVSFASNVTVNGNMVVQNTNTNGGIFFFISNNSTATRTMTVGGNLTFPSNAQTGTVNFGASSATTPIAVSLGGNFTLADTNVTMQNVGMTFSSSSNQTFTQSAGTISSLSTWLVNKASNSILTQTTAFTNSGTLSIATGTLSTAGFGLTASLGLSVGASGNLQIQGGETISTPTFATGATMTYDGTSSSYTLKNYSYKNLKLQGGVSTVFTQPATLTIAGDLNIATGTLDASGLNYSLNVSGNWLNTGSFTPRTGTVTLNGTDQTITGTSTFYNLTKSVSSPATLTFGEGQTQTISNVWTANGASGNLLSLRSSSSTSQWNINPQTTRTISFIDVRDSNNTNVTPIAITANMVNSGNNTNWGFDTTAPVISSVASSTGTSTATVTWTTDESASSSINYGLTTSYGTVASSSATTSHSVSLVGLTENTLYHFRVLAIDAATNTSTSTDYTFTTADGTAPVISVVASSTSATTATVTWTTNEPSTSVVDYGTSIAYGNASSSSSLVTSHSIVLSGLTDLTPYYFKVTSVDASSNSASSTGYILTTTDGTAPSVSVLSPTSLQVISGASVTLSATSTDNDGVAGVRFYIDDISVGSEIITAPYTFVWDSTVSTNGSHSVYAFARDASSNSASSTAIMFTVNNVTDPAPVVPTIAFISHEAVMGCKDIRARNYNQFSQHLQSLCVYEQGIVPIKITPIYSAYTFNKDLKMGNRDVAVKELQRYLNNNGFIITKKGAGSPGSETDQFGALTKSALIRFQRSKGIPATGFFGPKTRAKINQL